MKQKIYKINHLPVPEVLIQLMEANKWKTPSLKTLQQVIPFFTEEVEFLPTVEAMRKQTAHNLEDFDFFYEKHSDRDARANKLPYRDLKYSFLIAINKYAGDDIAIALDFRTSMEQPKVIANNWHTGIKGCPWEEVSPTFEDFFRQINLII